MRRVISLAVCSVVDFTSSFRNYLIVTSIIFVLASNAISQMPVPSPVQTPNVPGTYNPNLITVDDYEVYPSRVPTEPYYWIMSNDDTTGRIEVYSQSNSFGWMYPGSCHYGGCQEGGVLKYAVPQGTTGMGADVGYYYTAYFTYSRLARVTIVANTNTPDDAENAGESCPAVAEPVNVTNGNMWLKQTDFALPGRGKHIEVNRFYNSMIQAPGIFGRGWSTVFDESLQIHNSNLARVNMPDGRAANFVRETPTGLFMPHTAGMQAFIEANAGGTFTLTFKDGIKHQFNSGGRLTSITDRNGNQTMLNYTDNVLTGVTDASGRTLTISINGGLVENIRYNNETIASYTYSGTNLQNVTYQDGSQYNFAYVTAGGKTVLETVKDAQNKILEKHTYDSLARATTSEKEGGVEKYIFDYSNWTLTYPYSPYTLVKHKKNANDPNFIETKYYFNKTMTKNFVWKTEGSCNCGSGAEVTTFEYDNRLNLKKKSEQISTNLWRETTFTYNYQGDVVTRNEKVGATDLGTENFTYDPFGQVRAYQDKINSATVPPTNTLVNDYDANGNLTTITDALGNVTTITYPTTNNRGLPEKVKDARLNETKLKWFSSGLLDEIEDANTKKTNFTYDARGRIKTVTNALTHTTTYNYFETPTDRRVEMIYPNQDKITYTYDNRRLLQSITDERGKVTGYIFDNTHRLTRITDALGHFQEVDYDVMSNVKLYRDGLGIQTDYDYDDFNRLKEIIYPPAETGATRLKEKFEYDMVGRIKKITDTASRETVYNYDDAQRTVSVTNAEQETTQTKYNARMQAIEVKDALNQIYTFTYNPFGQVLTQTRAGGTLTYEYNEVLNRKKRVDYSGRETTYEYDALSRLKKINYLGGQGNSVPNQTAVYNYDDVSRLTSATNEAGTVSFGYDNRNRVTSTTDVFGHTLNYEYELTSTVNQERLKLDGVMYAKYNFDDANRLSNILNSADNTTTSYDYDNENKLTSRAFPNGVMTTYEYDDMDRLKRLKDTNSTATLFDRQYGYNNASQISQIVEPSLTRTFGYDAFDRLTSVSASNNQNESYLFDDVGNRTSSHLSTSYGYQPFNKLTSTATATYNYDADGNMTTKAGGSNFWRFDWDYENRLTKAAARKQTVRYVYDALGRRVMRYGTTQGKTKFTYDGEDVLLDDNDGTQTKYLNGRGIDNKLRQTTASNTTYFLSDHLGSTNGLADTSGNVTPSNSTAYDSFGNATNANFASRYQFTGREYDSFSGLHYYRARFYDGNLGRFISEDPIGFAGGDVNLYGYLSNNPLAGRDSFGLDAEYDQQLWRAQQDLIEAFEPAIEFGAGFGDTVLFGASRSIRQWQGIDSPLLDCSTSYQAGEWTAIVIQVAEGGVGIYRSGLKLAPKFLARRRARSFFQGAEYSPKVLGQMRNAKDPFHAFPNSVEGFATEYGNFSIRTGGDGNPYQWLEMAGRYRGKTGTFEFTKDASGVIDHRYFNRR
jgi:RHS repeat-associated protein